MVQETIRGVSLHLWTDAGEDQWLRQGTGKLEQGELGVRKSFRIEYLQSLNRIVNMVRENHAIELFKDGLR